MIKYLSILVLFAFSTTAHAWDERHWLWSASTTALVADWGTTLDIENHPGLKETNQYLGPHPSRGEVNRYFTGLLALHVIGNIAIQNIHNKDLRTMATWMENLYVSFEHGRCAYGNYQFGLRFEF